MTLNLDELRSFLTLASELHFRKAAERLFVSQPALSKQIQKLEEKTGGALFERTRRKVVLREAGRVLIPLAERLLRDSQAALDRVRQATEGRAGTLRIGFGIASASDLLPQTILRFRKTYPGIEIQMRDMSTPAQTRALLEEQIDIGIIRLPVARPELASLPLIRERLGVGGVHLPTPVTPQPRTPAPAVQTHHHITGPPTTALYPPPVRLAAPPRARS